VNAEPAPSANVVWLPDRLSDAEMRVLVWLPSHHTAVEIARHLHVSMNTVRSQKAAIYRKLNVHNRDEAVTVARRRGLIP